MKIENKHLVNLFQNITSIEEFANRTAELLTDNTNIIIYSNSIRG